MRNVRQKGLHKCPVCGGRALLRKNASKQFQVYCNTCAAKTGWERKTDAVVSWYELIIKYWETKGVLKA